MNNLNKDDEIKVTGVNGFKNNIVSFEDYDAEIRKPLKDEIERLKLELLTKNNTIQFAQNSYCILQEKNEQLKTELKQARTKVIDELEEWVKDYNYYMDNGIIYIIRKDLQQKLKELKGEK